MFGELAGLTVCVVFDGDSGNICSFGDDFIVKIEKSAYTFDQNDMSICV